MDLHTFGYTISYNKVLDLIYQETTLLQMKKEDKSEISSSLSSPVPRAGINGQNKRK